MGPTGRTRGRLPRIRLRRPDLRLGRRAPAGSSPGTLVADPDAPAPQIHVIAYGPEELIDRPVADPEELRELADRWPVTWVNVDGLGDAGTIARIGEVFGLHQLALEDVLTVHQRPKVEEYADQLFIVMRMALVDGRVIDSEQVSLFLGENYVLTFQERPEDCLGTVRQRLHRNRGRLRAAGSDYLAYTIVDAIVDHYFPVLEAYGDRLEDVEDEVIGDPTAETAARIHRMKRELLALRRAAWPLRELTNTLAREPHPLITEETRLYLRDCYDHAIQIIDLLENYREIASALLDVYLSSVSNRMNEVMKVLTVIATIFIPLTFIAGLYGMNFDPDVSPWNMPELGWYFGYPFALGLMLVVAVTLVLYFRRKDWL